MALFLITSAVVAAILVAMYKKVSTQERKLNDAGKTDLDYRLDDFFKSIGGGKKNDIC